MTYVYKKLIPDGKAKTFNNTTLENFKYIPEKSIKIFTFDNVKEFLKEIKINIGKKIIKLRPDIRRKYLI